MANAFNIPIQQNRTDVEANVEVVCAGLKRFMLSKVLSFTDKTKRLIFVMDNVAKFGNTVETPYLKPRISQTSRYIELNPASR